MATTQLPINGVFDKDSGAFIGVAVPGDDEELKVGSGALSTSSLISIPEYTKSTKKAALLGLPQNIPMPVKRGGVTLCYFDTAANTTRTSSSGTTSFVDDTSDPLISTTSVRAQINGGGTGLFTPKESNCNFASVGIDCTGKNIEVRIKRLSSSTVSSGTSLSVRIYSDGTPAAPSTTNYGQTGITTGAGDPWLTDDWQTFSLPIERFAVTGTLDITSIKYASIGMTGSVSGDYAFILGDIRVQPRALSKGLCVFCFSDNRADTWNYGAQQLAKYGFPGVAHPSPFASTLQESLTASNMSATELRKLQYLHGWQISAQAFTTESSTVGAAMTDDQFLAEYEGYCALARSIGVWGITDGSYHPAADVSMTNRTALLRQFFRTMRVSYTHSAAQVPWPETSPIADPMRLRSWSRNPANNSGAQMIAYCQKAADTKGIAVFSFHSSSASETIHAGETKTAFLTLLDWLHANRNVIEVATIDTAITRMAAG